MLLRTARGLLACVALLVAGCGSTPAETVGTPPVVLLTDFGLKDDAIGLMRGVILSIAPRSAIADLSHEVPAFDVAEGARLLGDGPGVYPPGSVFCVVVDPGVGTSRRAIVARLPDGTQLVAPDNGVLTEVLARYGPFEVREITNRALMRQVMSTTFHGRDVFAPVSAHLAAGVPFESVGELVTDWIKLDRQEPTREGEALVGVAVAIDRPFGNLLTNIPGGWLTELGLKRGDAATVRLGNAGKRLRVPLADTFGDVPEGEPLLYVNSRGRVSLALNMGNFAEAHASGRGTQVTITKE